MAISVPRSIEQFAQAVFGSSWSTSPIDESYVDRAYGVLEAHPPIVTLERRVDGAAVRARFSDGAFAQVNLVDELTMRRLNLACSRCGHYCVHVCATLLHLENIYERTVEPPPDNASLWRQTLRELADATAPEGLPVSMRVGGGVAQQQTLMAPGLVLETVGGDGDERDSLRFRPVLYETTDQRSRRRMSTAVWVSPHYDLEPVPAGGWDVAVARHLLPLLMRRRDQAGARLLDRASQSSRHAAEHPHAGLSIGDAKAEGHLLALLDTLPIFWAGVHQPIEYARGARVHLHWTRAADGCQRARLSVAVNAEGDLKHVGEGSVFKLFERALFVLDDRRGCYLLDEPYSLVATLQRCPPLPDDCAGEVRQKLATLTQPWRLALPETPYRARETNAPARGIVKVSGTGGIPALDVTFSYDGHSVDGRGFVAYEERDDAQGRVRIHRDRIAEERIRKRVEEISLTQFERARNEARWQKLPRADVDDLGLRAAQLLADDPDIDLVFEDCTPVAVVRDAVDVFGEISPLSTDQWLEFGIGCEIDGRRIDLLPVLRKMIGAGQLALDASGDEDGDQWIDIGDRTLVSVPVAKLRSMVAPIVEWLDRSAGGVAAAEGGRIRLRTAAVGVLEGLSASSGVVLRTDAQIQAMVDRLRSRRGEVSVPDAFVGTLRDYQMEGLRWLAFLADFGFGGILADDMGLGKTVQVIAHVLCERERGRLEGPVLVVVPLSVVGQWRDRIAQFAPSLKVLTLVGQRRANGFARIHEHDIVISTYQLICRDSDALHAVEFGLLVWDETRNVKNPTAQASKALRDIRAKRRLAVGGTPLENNLLELWANIDAAEPGVLGNRDQFTRLFRTPIEKRQDAGALERLQARIAPLILRRTKAEVALELPLLQEEVVHVQMVGRQRELYEILRVMVSNEILELLQKEGLTDGGMVALARLLRLRQVCVSPEVLPKPLPVKGRVESCKEEWFCDNVPTLIADGRRVLVFSYFAEVISQLAGHAERMGIDYSVLVGGMSPDRRESEVRRFQDGETRLFFLTYGTGGEALDLWRADTVIHYEPFWNPQREHQASSRAHRGGNTAERVYVYKLIVQGTLEEAIVDLQRRKEALANAVLDGGSTDNAQVTEADIRRMLQPIS
jgi:hypothetical protein